VALACGGGDTASTTTAEVDPDGVEIVRSSGNGAWGGTPAWRFEADLSIGGISAPIEEQFGNIGPLGGIAVSPDGSIYILDVFTRELRAFDSTGACRRTIGRPGEGPGEFGEELTTVLVGSEGQLVVPDLANQSIHRFSPDGEYLDSPRLQVANSDFGAFIPLRWDRMADGRIVAQLRTFTFGPEGLGGAESDVIVALDADGQPTDTVLMMKTGETLAAQGDGVPLVTIFAPEPVWSVGGNGGLVTARTDAFRLTIHAADGSVDRIIERDVPARIITERDVDELLEAGGAAIARELGAGITVPTEILGEFLRFGETFPLLVQIMSGPDGTLWVRGVEDPVKAMGMLEGIPRDLQSFGGRLLSVFDGDGAYLGDMELPDRFKPVIWEGESLYGIQLDDLDVQTVVRLRLVRG